MFDLQEWIRAVISPPSDGTESSPDGFACQSRRRLELSAAGTYNRGSRPEEAPPCHPVRFVRPSSPLSPSSPPRSPSLSSPDRPSLPPARTLPAGSRPQRRPRPPFRRARSRRTSSATPTST
ncbi:MAG: hypothetical protein MZU84_08270 [Sphingobacterium sp.]|nr:hypothetical protein [Sphingobacterium sp.]